MIELIQVPYSPFCIVQRRILEFSGAKFKIRNVPNGDRSLIWKLTRERYYAVPIVREGAAVIFETSEDSQVIAKYLDARLGLGLFPAELEGLQDVLWRDIEGEIEGRTFKLNDAHAHEFVPPADWLRFVRHKERKFGRGCLDQWRASARQLQRELATRLAPYESMLATRPFLLDARPRFVDFDLFGMLGNFLYSGHYQLPRQHPRLRAWYGRMEKIKFRDVQSEKLRP